MKKTFIILVLLIVCLVSNAQIKMHSNGQISLQSTTTTGGVQIETTGKTTFKPNITTSYSVLNQTLVQSLLLKVWSINFSGNNFVEHPNRFYVISNGDVYSNNYYSIESGGYNKGQYAINNASEIINGLNGYYFDCNEFEGFVPDFEDNPNVAPEAVEGLMDDLKINKSVGLSAAELEAVLPEAIRHDPEGAIYINYTAIVPVLVEAFKEQQRTIESLQKEIANIKKENGGTSGVAEEESSICLYQNAPNPTSSSTSISCFIDVPFSKAIIAIYDLSGAQLKEYSIGQQGKNTVFIEANEFKPGIYLYSLLVDGTLIDTKRMVVTTK